MLTHGTGTHTPPSRAKTQKKCRNQCLSSPTIFPTLHSILPAQNQQSQFICLPLGSLRQICGCRFLGFNKDINLLGGSIFNISPQASTEETPLVGDTVTQPLLPWTGVTHKVTLATGSSTQESPSPKVKAIPRLCRTLMLSPCSCLLLFYLHLILIKTCQSHNPIDHKKATLQLQGQLSHKPHQRHEAPLRGE